ncbi:HD-GYP domain-containing protein [Cyanobium sp. ATX 6F1]|uniref:HD-GYP domain-containing protein n=1 Tax=unclassified Cyanobium TaxID=2627006 RepID=UPI0020CD3D14|nr:HD domain-containing phosphohydrolase [Cyanobium sp. ATX 6F1]
MAVLEARDSVTYVHSQRMADLSAALAIELGLNSQDALSIRVGALLHDIGMIALPIDILSKPRELSISELAAVTGHPLTGYAVLRNIPLPLSMNLAVLQHHERLDGSGYPHGLKGQAICQAARILAVADTVEAMVSERPYRDAPGLDAALDLIEQGKHRLFDSKVVEACCRLFLDKDYAFPESFPSYLNPESSDSSNSAGERASGGAERPLF